MPQDSFENFPQGDAKGIVMSKTGTEPASNSDDKSSSKISIANYKIIYYGNSDSKPSNKQ